MGGKNPRGYTCPNCGTENIKVLPLNLSYWNKRRRLGNHLTPNGLDCQWPGMIPTDRGSSYEETNKTLDRRRSYESFDYWIKK